MRDVIVAACRASVCVARWSSPRYCVGECRAARVEVALDEAVDCMGHLTEQPGDVVVPRRRQRMRPHRAIGAGGEHAIGEPGVGVAIEVEHAPG
jgi:hypothetical protein